MHHRSKFTAATAPAKVHPRVVSGPNEGTVTRGVVIHANRRVRLIWWLGMLHKEYARLRHVSLASCTENFLSSTIQAFIENIRDHNVTRPLLRNTLSRKSGCTIRPQACATCAIVRPTLPHPSRKFLHLLLAQGFSLPRGQKEQVPGSTLHVDTTGTESAFQSLSFTGKSSSI